MTTVKVTTLSKVYRCPGCAKPLSNFHDETPSVVVGHVAQCTGVRATEALNALDRWWADLGGLLGQPKERFIITIEAPLLEAPSRPSPLGSS